MNVFAPRATPPNVQQKQTPHRSTLNARKSVPRQRKSVPFRDSSYHLFRNIVGPIWEIDGTSFHLESTMRRLYYPPFLLHVASTYESFHELSTAIDTKSRNSVVSREESHSKALSGKPRGYGILNSSAKAAPSRDIGPPTLIPRCKPWCWNGADLA